jgi:hypothetical protein
MYSYKRELRLAQATGLMLLFPGESDGYQEVSNETERMAIVRPANYQATNRNRTGQREAEPESVGPKFRPDTALIDRIQLT